MLGPAIQSLTAAGNEVGSRFHGSKFKVFYANTKFKLNI